MVPKNCRFHVVCHTAHRGMCPLQNHCDKLCSMRGISTRRSYFWLQIESLCRTTTKVAISGCLWNFINDINFGWKKAAPRPQLYSLAAVPPLRSLSLQTPSTNSRKIHQHSLEGIFSKVGRPGFRNASDYIKVVQTQCLFSSGKIAFVNCGVNLISQIPFESRFKNWAQPTIKPFDGWVFLLCFLVRRKIKQLNSTGKGTINALIPITRSERRKLPWIGAIREELGEGATRAHFRRVQLSTIIWFKNLMI